MLVTVAICTWNRSALLDQTLVRMRDLRIPVGTQWEVIVVNNNSTDDTEAICTRHEADGRLPLRLTNEPKQGHSNARNRGISEAKGDLIIWTDDDVRVEPNWIEAYCEAAANYPKAAFFGGTVKPDFAAPPPEWVANNIEILAGPYAIASYGEDVRWLKRGEYPVGANMAFRSAIQKERPFDPMLGRVGKELTSCDETLYCKALEAAGYQGVWVGNAIVHHHVPQDRMTWDYIRRWYIGLGKINGRVDPLPTCQYWFDVPRYMWRVAAAQLGRRLLNSILPNEKSLEVSIKAAELKGAWREIRARRRTARRGEKSCDRI